MRALVEHIQEGIQKRIEDFNRTRRKQGIYGTWLNNGIGAVAEKFPDLLEHDLRDLAYLGIHPTGRIEFVPGGVILSQERSLIKAIAAAGHTDVAERLNTELEAQLAKPDPLTRGIKRG